MSVTTTENPAEPSQMVYTPEAARITGKHPKVLIRLANEGRFPRSIKIGNRHAWPRPVLMAFLGLAPAAMQATM